MKARIEEATRDTGNGSERGESRWRVTYWTAVVLVLLAPLVAMQFTDEMNWTVFDFAFAGVALLGVGLSFEIVVRKTSDGTYRIAAGVALAAALLLVWLNGAVGIIGSEANDVNLLYYGVLVAGGVGTLVARFRARGMARAMAVTALAQAAIAAGALVAGLASPQSGPFEIVALNGFFVALWIGSAVLFRKAARERSPAGAGPEG